MSPYRFLVVVTVFLLSSVARADVVRVERARAWAAPDGTRVVFDVSGPIEHRVSVLHDPERVVVDMVDVQLNSALDSLNTASSVYSGTRYAMRDQDTLRVVFDLSARVRPKSFVLKPNERYGHRLVIDLNRDDVSESSPANKNGTEVSSKELRDVVIAIDAGHGGEDPGAIGSDGTQEKDVALAIAQRVAKLVEKEPGMRPMLVRSGDYFVSLGGRKRVAQNNKADMFVSIHADSSGRNSRARGASVFAVSAKGASSEAARLLADSENTTDLIGGVNLDDKDDMLTSVLLDLSQSGTIEASVDLGGRVLDELGRIGGVHKGRVEQAGFVVLKSLGIPSILVEAGFISNRSEEYKLRDPMYQEMLASSIVRGVRSYFADHAPPGTVLSVANVKHVVQPGDTLAGIAQRYQVSMTTLRHMNDMSDDLLEVGKVLRVPQLENLVR